MTELRRIVVTCVVLGIWACQVRALPTTEPAALRASDLRGQVYSLSDARNVAAVGLVFLSTECPISRRYIPELNRISASLPHSGDKQIQLLGVISDPTVTRAAAVQFAHDYKIDFPILFDASGEIAQQFSPKMTPQAFVLDHHGKIQYKGRIDDTFIDLRKQRETAEHHDLLDALTAVAAGQKPQSAETEAVGCFFEAWNDKSKSPAVTYTRDIAPILNSNCVQCHRDGQVAPFSLLKYEQAAHHAKQIARVTNEKLMPPWKALPGFGHFVDERRLTDREISLIAQWARAGAPQGNPADLPPSPTFADGGWTLGTPDIVLQLPKPFTVPASGHATSVLHHALFFLDNTGRARELEAASKDGQPGYRSFGGVGFLPSGGLGGVTLLGVTPHMHLIGKQMNVTAYPPDGSAIPLIKIDDWDFRWQDQYRYAEPIHLPRGTVIKLHAVRAVHRICYHATDPSSAISGLEDCFGFTIERRPHDARMNILTLRVVVPFFSTTSVRRFSTSYVYVVIMPFGNVSVFLWPLAS